MITECSMLGLDLLNYKHNAISKQNTLQQKCSLQEYFNPLSTVHVNIREKNSRR